MGFLLAILFLLLGIRGAAANGVPVQIFLDYLPFKATWEAANGARGVAVVASNDEQVRVMAQRLPQPPAGLVYYAWLEEVEGGFLPVGELVYAGDGTASIDQPMPNLPYSENFAWVLVSLERPGAIAQAPAAEIALAGRLPNPVALPVTGDEVPSLLPVTGGLGKAPQNTAAANLWLPVALLALGATAAVGLRWHGVSGADRARRTRASFWRQDKS